MKLLSDNRWYGVVTLELYFFCVNVIKLLLSGHNKTQFLPLFMLCVLEREAIELYPFKGSIFILLEKVLLMWY